MERIAYALTCADTLAVLVIWASACLSTAVIFLISSSRSQRLPTQCWWSVWERWESPYTQSSWDSIHINGSFSILERFFLPFDLHGICWIDTRSWLDSLVFSPKGSSAKSYTPSLIQPSINCKQLKREHRGSSTRQASCEEEVEWTPISFNTSLLSLKSPYCFNINWETVHCSRFSLLFSILNEVERKLFFKALHHIIYTRWQLVVPWQGVQLQSSG